jgi:hypothetical protein
LLHARPVETLPPLSDLVANSELRHLKVRRCIPNMGSDTTL